MSTKKKIKKEKINLEEIFQFDNDQENLEFEEMVINSEFVKIVRDLMKKENMTQEELAIKLDVTPAFISMLFSSDRQFNVNLLAKIQRVFGSKIKIVTSDMVRKKGIDVDLTSYIQPQFNQEGVVKFASYNATSESKLLNDIESNEQAIKLKKVVL